MKSYGIIFDTVFIRSGGDNVVADKVFNSTLEEINEFLRENNVKSVNLYVPEIVLKEILVQRNERINKHISSIGKCFEELSVFGVEAPTASYKETDYKNLLKEQSSAYLSKQGISIVEPSEDALAELTERALSHTKPFKQEGDKGFKDTLLWLSVIGHFSRGFEDVCLLLSANTSDFNDSLVEEFFVRTGKSIVFISTIQDLKEYLDKEIPLNLHLKRLHDEITNEVKGKIGDIVLYLNTNQVPDSRTTFLGSLYVPTIFTSDRVETVDLLKNSSREKELIGYTFYDIKVDNIKLMENNMYQIDAEILVDNKYKDSYSDTLIQPPTYYTNVFRLTPYDAVRTSFIVRFIYNRESSVIDVVSCIKGISFV